MVRPESFPEARRHWSACPRRRRARCRACPSSGPGARVGGARRGGRRAAPDQRVPTAGAERPLSERRRRAGPRRACDDPGRAARSSPPPASSRPERAARGICLGCEVTFEDAEFPVRVRVRPHGAIRGRAHAASVRVLLPRARAGGRRLRWPVVAAPRHPHRGKKGGGARSVTERLVLAAATPDLLRPGLAGEEPLAAAAGAIVPPARPPDSPDAAALEFVLDPLQKGPSRRVGGSTSSSFAKAKRAALSSEPLATRGRRRPMERSRSAAGPWATFAVAGTRRRRRRGFFGARSRFPRCGASPRRGLRSSPL